MLRTISASGTQAMIGYAILTSVSSIIIHHISLTTPPLLSAFYTFTICIVIYALLAGKQAALIRTAKLYWMDISILNITTAICWLFSFLSLKFLSPELYLFIYLCAMPICGAIIDKQNIIKNILLFGLLIMLAMTYHSPAIVIGFILAFIGGASGTLYSSYSKKLSAHFSTLQILSLRFHLTVLIAFIFCYINHELAYPTTRLIITYSAISIISVIVPLILFQIGLKKLTLSHCLSYLPLAPVLCYLFNIAIGTLPFNLIQTLIILSLSITMLPI